MTRLLLTNDDGIEAAGLRALEEALAPLGEVSVVAPREERSAASHSISLRRTLEFLRLDERRWAVDGTPADAVILALHHLFDFRPDLVISGINHGPNLGKDVHYSGTVGAAAEAVLNGIPAIAVSLCARPPFEFEQAAAFAARVARQALSHGIPKGVLLNVNVPRPWSNGVRATRIYRHLAQTTLRIEDGLRLHEHVDFENAPADSDYAAIRSGSVSISPLALLSAEESLDAKFIESLGD